MFTIGQKVVAILVDPLQGNKVAPPLKKGVQYVIKNITKDSAGNPHLDVGLKSDYSYVTSWETKEELPDGDKIHWCHPSRFVAD